MTEQPTPYGSPAPRPIPDLGFFGPPARGTSALGSAPVPAPPSSPAAGNRFDGAAGNQFGGAPAPVFGAPAPPAYAGPSPEHKSRSRSGFSGIPARGIIGTVVVLVVLGVFGFGRLSFVVNLIKGDLKVPGTLSGVPHVTGPQAEEAERHGRQTLSSNGASKPLFAIYSSGPTTLILGAARGRADLDAELRDAGLDPSQATKIGNNTCAAKPEIAFCMRSTRTLSVFVGGPHSMEQVSAAVDEAWDKL